MDEINAERLQNFEKMFQAVNEGYTDAIKRMDQLKKQGKMKSVTYKQLLAQKMTYKNMLDLYRLFDIH